jgi:hypothetical protein
MTYRLAERQGGAFTRLFRQHRSSRSLGSVFLCDQLGLENATETGWGGPFGCSSFHSNFLVDLRLRLAPVVSLSSMTRMMSISPVTSKVRVRSSCLMVSKEDTRRVELHVPQRQQ